MSGDSGLGFEDTKVEAVGMGGVRLDEIRVMGF